jgi:hypothetical protein
MRKAIIAAATLATLAFAPLNANAQNAVGGAIVGGAAGAAIGGAVTRSPEGAAVGAAIGATTGAAVGANADVRGRYYYNRRYYNHRHCWRDDWGRRHCRYY